MTIKLSHIIVIVELGQNWVISFTCNNKCHCVSCSLFTLCLRQKLCNVGKHNIYILYYNMVQGMPVWEKLVRPLEGILYIIHRYYIYCCIQKSERNSAVTYIHSTKYGNAINMKCVINSTLIRNSNLICKKHRAHALLMLHSLTEISTKCCFLLGHHDFISKEDTVRFPLLSTFASTNQ